MLRRAGFFSRSAKGSHTVWEHPLLSSKVTLSGKDDRDARRYQEADVMEVLELLRRMRDE